MNLVVNCSSDRLQLRIGTDYHEYPNQWLELVFPQWLLQTIQHYNITHIYVINGPGSFTTLRVICLTINLYHNTHPWSISITSCTKLELLHSLLSWRIDTIAIYIGQRNNVRLYNTNDNHHILTTKSTLESDIIFDDVSDVYHSNQKVQWYIEWSYIGLKLNHTTIAQIELDTIMKPSINLQPHYMIQPHVS